LLQEILIEVRPRKWPADFFELAENYRQMAEVTLTLHAVSNHKDEQN